MSMNDLLTCPPPTGPAPSRMSEISLQTLSTKYQYFFLCSSFIMIFLMGIFVGALIIKIFLCLGSAQGQVTSKVDSQYFITHLLFMLLLAVN